MFESARLKLTAWYLLIIMIVSVVFSLIIFSGVNSELRRYESFWEIRQQRLEQGRILTPTPRGMPVLDLDTISEARGRLILIFVLINTGILVTSAVAGYFLAGKTLYPIKVMMDDQNRFVADASHELRTPLTALKISTEVALRDKKLTLSQAKQLLNENLVEADHLQYLSDNLLRLIQFDSSSHALHFSKFSLSEATVDAIKKVKPKADEKNIIVENQVKNTYLFGDKNSIIELFVILLDNAIKYSPSEKPIVISSRNLVGAIELSVKDQGIGIAKNDIPHIFDRFYRVEKSRTKESVNGYGLGLSIAKKIVDLHKGSISVLSNTKSGSTFNIRLPNNLKGKAIKA